MIKIFSPKHERQSDPFAIKEGIFRNAKLAAGYRLNWTEEGLLGEREAEKSGDKIGRNISRQKINWIAAAIIFASFLLVGRAFSLQIYHNDYYQELSRSNRLREQGIPADRGVIYDNQGEILVSNSPVFYLQVIPADLLAAEIAGYNITAVNNKIGDILGKESAENLDYLLVRYRRNKSGQSLEAYQPQIIADDINYYQALRLMIITTDIAGISVQVRSRRSYNLPAVSLSHVLGYIGALTPEEYKAAPPDYLLTDYIGKTGLEKYWEKELRGVYGEKYIEVDALGREKRIIREVSKEDGAGLMLAINSALQVELEKDVKSQLEISGAARAAAIILNPQNGEVLALVSWPSFNSNDFSDKIKTEIYQKLVNDPNQPLFNRAVSGEFPTGSTFKPVVAAAALQENVITENTIVNSTGGLRINVWFFPDWKAGGHGATNVRSALAWSVNTFFYYIGGGYNDFEGLGVQRITDYARLFGLGAPLGIDLPNEAAGFLPSKEWKEDAKKEMWYIGDTYHLAIGQGDITATPLQVAAYTSFFANGGTLYQPHIVKQLLDSQGQLVKNIEPAILRHDFIEEKNIEIVRQGMRDCVAYGSCRSLDSLAEPVAGKTGTAQWSSDPGQKTHSWFTGFAPFNNPELVITILVEEGGETTDAAVPIAKKVLEWYFKTQEH